MMEAVLQERLDLCSRLATRLAQARSALVTAAGEDIGTPCATAGMEVDLAVAHLRTMHLEVSQVAGKPPYGTVAAIFPYDAAPVMLARVGGAAILGGNRFRFSCSSQTPATAAVLRQVTAPFHVLEMATETDNRAFGGQCVADPEVRVLFISGGAEVGEVYARQVHCFDKLFFAGPSGLPPAILLADAALPAAVRFVVQRAFLNGGQYCTTIKRLYVHQQRLAEVRRLIREEMRRIRVGTPEDPQTWIGPLKVGRTRELLTRALAALRDFRFLTPYRREGIWQGPFVVETPEPPDVELFGPFLALVPAATDAAAVAAVLQSRYPFLAAWFGTLPPGARQDLSTTFGMVYDNPDFLFTPLRLPFGGKGASGWILENRQGIRRRREGAFQYSAELVRS